MANGGATNTIGPEFALANTLPPGRLIKAFFPLELTSNAPDFATREAR